MACFPGFSTLALFAAGLAEGFTAALAAALTGGLLAGFAAALGAALALGFAAVLDCALCGFLLLGFMGLAVGMGPPVVGNCFKYRSATSKQKCTLAPVQKQRRGHKDSETKTGEAKNGPGSCQWAKKPRGRWRFSFSGKLFGRTFGVQSLRKFLGGIGRLICGVPDVSGWPGRRCCCRACRRKSDYTLLPVFWAGFEGVFGGYLHPKRGFSDAERVQRAVSAAVLRLAASSM
jgi:hypothetical protein